MHPDDQMTPNERLQAYFSGDNVDRIPALPFYDSSSGKIAGMTHREKRSDAEHIAKAQIVTYQKMGQDGATIEYGLHGVGHACGSVWDNPEDAVPAIVEHVIKSLDDVATLNLSDIRKENDPWLKSNLDATVICLEEIGDECPVGSSLPGPMTAAASIIPIETLLKGTRKQPEQVEELLDFCVEAINYVVDEFLALGAEPTICDPVASYNIMPVRDYESLVLPRTQKIFSHIHDRGAEGAYHICGNTTAMTQLMVESGCDMLSIDTAVSLKFAKETVGDKVPIVGNVDPNLTMLLGNKDSIRRNMKENLRDAWDSPCGYIISTGCDIPINSPLENNYYFMEIARELGKWPIDPERFV